tara:strand:+ start:321 stop:938 length:618 start_codon:yes stop_codon:yes gene_type:complete
MKQKNENELLVLKNYSNFLVDLGLNISFFQEYDFKIKQSKIEKNHKSIQDLDNYVKEWQIENNFQLILRNYNMSSKLLLLLSEENNFKNFDQFKKNQPELLEKMFASIGHDIDDFCVINIDFEKMTEIYLNKIKEILKLYFEILNPKIFIDMYSDDLSKIFKIEDFDSNFDYIKIPSVSNINKNQSLKRDAWSQLKLLKVKINEF